MMTTVERERSRASRAMDAYADGDGAAFAVLYDELAPRVYAFTRRMTQRDAVAEDIVQQCFINVHQARARFVRGAHVEPWIFAIARRLTIDWARSERRVREIGAGELFQDGAQGPEREARQSELIAALRMELESLPESLREAFLLIRVEGFSVSEAAEVLGTTVAAVKLRAYRAGLLLRPELVDFGPERDSK